MNLIEFAKRAEEIVAIADKVIPTFRVSAYGTEYDYEAYHTFRSAGLSFLANTFGEGHAYYTEFDRETKEPYSTTAKAGRGILLAARDEVVGGWAVTARGLVSAEIFGDFIEMARYLLSEHYKDAAAVVAGSALEEHLRQLARKHNVDMHYMDPKREGSAQKGRGAECRSREGWRLHHLTTEERHSLA